MTERQDDLNEIRALLPWYVSGTLDEVRAAKVRAQVAASRELAAEVAWLARLRALARDAAGAGSEERAGLEALLARVASEQAPRRGGAVAVHRTLRPAARGWRAALAIACALLVVQGLAVLALLQREQRGPQWIGAVTAPAAMALLQVAFRGDAREADIRAALGEVGARIVDGPGALGVYGIVVPAAEAERARDALARNGGVVERVSVSSP